MNATALRLSDNKWVYLENCPEEPTKPESKGFEFNYQYEMAISIYGNKLRQYFEQLKSLIASAPVFADQEKAGKLSWNGDDRKYRIQHNT